MEREAVVSNTLEEFRERLERWGELCSLLRELYYKYLDLAAFRSEKCYFPGRRCKRSWKREYDVGDLTLMWMYILNTVPLCGKLMKALAEVEYKIRREALNALRRIKTKIRKSKPDKLRGSNRELTMLHLGDPLRIYLALWRGKLYVVWEKINGLPRQGRKRATEIERKIADIITEYENGKNVNMLIESFEVDDEYRRLWFEVPLPTPISELLGGKGSAPVALFRNLGWLLSDDSREDFVHEAGNIGQISVRIFDWISLITYVITVRKMTLSKPLVFRLEVYYVVNGENPNIRVAPIGSAKDVLKTAYEHFGITLDKSEAVLMRGYSVLSALKDVAFRDENDVRVVDDVGAWIAFSNAVATLVLGDGYIQPVKIAIVAKDSLEKTLYGETSLVKELTKAVGGARSRNETCLKRWHMRLLLPTPPTPAFEKATKLYETFVANIAAALVKVNGVIYLLYHREYGKFQIGKEKAMELYDYIKRMGLKARLNKHHLVVSYWQLERLRQSGIFVQYLTELEREHIKEVKTVFAPSLEDIKRVLEELSKIAEISLWKARDRYWVAIIPHDRSKLGEVVAILKNSRIRFGVQRRDKVAMIYDQKLIDMIKSLIFSNAQSDTTCAGVTSVQVLCISVRQFDS